MIADRAPFGLGARVLPRRRDRSNAAPIVWMDEANEAVIAELDPALPGRSVGPSVGGRQPVGEVMLPAVRAYHFRGASVCIDSSSIVAQGKLFLERPPEISTRRVNLAAGRIRWHGHRIGLIAELPQRRLSRGLFLGGNGSFNYYHWLVEILAKVQYAERANLDADIPYLVPPEYRTLRTFRDAFKRVATTERPITVLDRNVAYLVDDLLYITTPNNSPFNLRGAERPRVRDVALRKATVDHWRAQTSESRDASKGDQRLFLRRTPARRLYNAADVLAVVRQFGFIDIMLETLPFDEQVRLMASAGVLVGPSGAAWSNLTFCRPGTRALSWLPEPAREFSAYSNIAAVVGVDLRYLTFAQDVRRTAQLHEAPYYVDPRAVEMELARLVD